MPYITPIKNGGPVPCPYLPDRLFTQQYRFGFDLTPEEWGADLAQGWRRFGTYFFRPACGGCRACTPLRVLTRELRPTSSQTRVLRRNDDLDLRVRPLAYDSELFEIYRDHKRRFTDPADDEPAEEPDEDDFRASFFEPGAPALLMEYRHQGRLLAWGFCDQAAEGLSSVYFAFRPEEGRRSLGTYSVFAESAWARDRGLPYYYLGYWIAAAPRLAYKGRFFPHEIYRWDQNLWVRREEAEHGLSE